VSHEGRAEVGPAEYQVFAGLCLELQDLVGDRVPHDGGVPVGPLQVLENTILGMSGQMRANSTMAPVLEGFVSAVGQNPAISS
jgi:hypothetical protein